MEVEELRARESIRRTLVNYNLHGDRGRIDGLVTCFAPDGVLELEHEWTARGRDAIRQQIARASELTAQRSFRHTLLRHHLSTQGIEIDSDEEARAWSYFTAVTEIGPDHVGRYIDALCRIDGQWLIRHRRVRIEWWAADTIFVDQAERARRAQRRSVEEAALATAATDDVRVDVREGVGWITLNRPEVMNRIEGTMREQIFAALIRFATDASVRCVAITGTGEAFSAGANVDDMAAHQEAGNAEEIRRRVALGGSIVRTVREMPKPVVAVLNGVAAGAAMNLALACDFRVGGPRAAFASSFVRLGLIPDWGGLYFLTQRVGASLAAELMMTGRRVDAVEAMRIGLLEHLYPAESFSQDVRDFLGRLVAGPPLALAAIKKGIDLGTKRGLEAVLAFDPEEQKRLFLTDDCREGIAAFREKRRPSFGGPARPG